MVASAVHKQCPKIPIRNLFLADSTGPGILLTVVKAITGEVGIVNTRPGTVRQAGHRVSGESVVILSLESFVGDQSKLS